MNAQRIADLAAVPIAETYFDAIPRSREKPRTSPLTSSWARIGDYIELTKPRVAVLVLFTVAAGALLGSGGAVGLGQLLHALLGTALVAGGASALNQLLERHSDALMRRTENRPLPSGRLTPMEATLFGLALGLGGLIYLAVVVKQPVAVLVAAVTFFSYVFLYTPLKRRTTLNTLVGALPGALPPVIGWTAATGSIDAGAAALFVLLFLWQVPHFLAIAWIYREDYAGAGLRVLPVFDKTGAATALQMILYCLALVPASMAPLLLHQAGWMYAVGAILLGIAFLCSALAFQSRRSDASARWVLRASLIYLPVLLALLLLENLI